MTSRQPTDTDIVIAFYEDRLAAAGMSSGCPLVSALAPDYGADLLATLPQDAVQSSFGCGNPLAFADVKPGQTVVDLGCGAGLDLLIAAERAGPSGRVIGVDASPAMVAAATARTSAAGHANVEVLEGRIEALPLADGSADWVISNCVLNLSNDKAAAFREIARILRPGGRMLISDIVVQDLPSWLSCHADLHAACITGATNEAHYLALAAAAGLSGAHVVERFVYDAEALGALIRSELPGALRALAAGLGVETDLALARIVADTQGKIATVKVAGFRPAT